MNFTETFFAFPVKIYNKKELTSIISETYKQSPDDSKLDVTPSWVRGIAKIPFDEIKAWMDDYDRDDLSPEEMLEAGADCTYVLTHSLGPFECLWKRERFESELNKQVGEIKDKVKEIIQNKFGNVENNY